MDGYIEIWSSLPFTLQATGRLLSSLILPLWKYTVNSIWGLSSCSTFSPTLVTCYFYYDHTHGVKCHLAVIVVVLCWETGKCSLEEKKQAFHEEFCSTFINMSVFYQSASCIDALCLRKCPSWLSKCSYYHEGAGFIKCFFCVSLCSVMCWVLIAKPALYS